MNFLRNRLKDLLIRRQLLKLQKIFPVHTATQTNNNLWPVIYYGSFFVRITAYNVNNHTKYLKCLFLCVIIIKIKYILDYYVPKKINSFK